MSESTSGSPTFAHTRLTATFAVLTFTFTCGQEAPCLAPPSEPTDSSCDYSAQASDSSGTLTPSGVTAREFTITESGASARPIEWIDLLIDAQDATDAPNNDEEFATREALASLIKWLDHIAKHLRRPDTWAFDAGEIIIEQHDGPRAVLCRISPSGGVRISQFDGPKRTGNPIIL